MTHEEHVWKKKINSGSSSVILVDGEVRRRLREPPFIYIWVFPLLASGRRTREAEGRSEVVRPLDLGVERIC